MSRNMLSTTREPMTVKLHREFLHSGQALADGTLALHRADDQQKAATAGAGQLSARRPGVKCAVYRQIDLVV